MICEQPLLLLYAGSPNVSLVHSNSWLWISFGQVESLKTQLKQTKDNDLVTKERDKLRVKIRHLAEDHKVALEAASAGAGNYEVMTFC